MKKFLAMLMMATLLMSFTALPAMAEGDEVVWLSLGGTWEDRTKDIIDKYNEETGSNIVAEYYAYSDMFEIIEVKIASGTTDYDIISVDVPMVAPYVNRGYLAPVDEYYTAEEKALYIDSAVAAGSWDGTFYAPPMNTSAQCLWYNKDLLAQAGVTLPENTPEDRLTWEEVVTIANQVLDVVNPDRNNGIFGLDWQQVSRNYQMNSIANSLGGKNIGEDGFTADGVINSQEWIDALTWYQGLVNSRVASQGITADEMLDYFIAGKLVFMPGGTWTASDCNTKGFTNYGYCAMPVFEGHEDQIGTPTGSWHFGINAPSEHKDEAAAFIKYITLGEGNDMWLKANGDVPSTKTALDEVITSEDAEGYLKIAAYEAANTAVPRALTPGYSEYNIILDATWEDIRNGADVTDSLNYAVEQIESALAKYK